MNFDGIITAMVKTLVTGAVTSLVAWGSVTLGLDLGQFETEIQAGALVLSLGAVNFALNWLSAKLPILAKIISLGRAADAPKYQKPVETPPETP